MSLAILRKELRELRKTHCPPISKLKKADIEKEIDRLKGHKPTEIEVKKTEPKPRVKNVQKVVKKEAREIETQTDEPVVESMADRMTKVRAAKEEKKEPVEDKKKKNEETMAKALGQLRQVEKEAAERNKARKEIAEMAQKPKRRKLTNVKTMAIALDEKIKKEEEPVKKTKGKK